MEKCRGSAFACHSWVSLLVGRVKQKLAPRGGLSAAHKRPPCDSTMERLMANPIPVPCRLVVKKALKIWFACFGGSPTALSLTEIIRCSFSTICDFVVFS